MWEKDWNLKHCSILNTTYKKSNNVWFIHNWFMWVRTFQGIVRSQIHSEWFSSFCSRWFGRIQLNALTQCFGCSAWQSTGGTLSVNANLNLRLFGIQSISHMDFYGVFVSFFKLYSTFYRLSLIRLKNLSRIYKIIIITILKTKESRSLNNGFGTTWE